MATQPQPPDNALPVPPAAPDEPQPEQERELLPEGPDSKWERRPGEPELPPVPATGVAKATKEQQEFWERLLATEGLSMDKGDGQRVSKTDRRRRVVYVGDDNDAALVDSMANNKIAGGGRRVRPKGTPPDADNDD